MVIALDGPSLIMPKARESRHKKSKIEEALGSFKEFLKNQNCKQSDMTKEMHNQWLEMEKMKLKSRI